MIARGSIGTGIALAALVGGCAVGPNYHPPTPPAGAESPLVSVNPSAESVSQPPDDWWRLYDDAELDGLVQRAFTNNEDLAVAEANLSAARASLENARNGLYPQTNIGLGAIRGRDPTVNEILEFSGQKPRTFWLYDDILDVSYELDLFGRVRRTLQAARADAQAAIAARDSVKITVAAETTRAYAEVCDLGEELAVARRSVDVVTREADIFARRLQAGGGSEFDLVRAQQLVAQARASIPPLEGQRRAALFQLTALVGQTPSHAPFEAEACVTPPRLSTLVPVGDGASLLRRRPDVRLAERRLAAATARVGVATADLYPQISLTAFYGGGAPQLFQLPRTYGLIWGVGPKISWTFPNQAGVRARIHFASAQSDAALAGFDSTVLQALKETEQSLTTYGAELNHRQALADAQAKAQRALDMADGQLRDGAASPLDVLTSEQTLVAADAAVAASNSALAEDQIAVFKALGGGWASPSPPRAAGK
ncbi:MAG TPA: efflux transporter outer membrane subunit [Caulobacteraceae bacterium]|jgi:NodT family efflux transporter outer membrane factor (OMF) lipoprotein